MGCVPLGTDITGFGMTAWSEMGGTARAGAVAGAVAVVATLAYALWPRDTPVRPTADPAGVTQTPPAEPSADLTAAAPPQTAGPAPIAAPQPPAFDSWRVDADGSAVVSGRAAPGSVIAVLVDGISVAEGVTNPRGEFVALFTLPANPNPSLMTLRATGADGVVTLSSQTVALGAIAGPVVVVADVPEPIAEPAVAAPDSPAEPPKETTAAVLITEDGVQVAQAPNAGQVTLDAIAYTPLGDVMISGSGQGGQFARLYLDQTLVATAPIAQTGLWSVTLGDTPPGIYTLRVDQVEADGTVTARVETPFQRETREALAALMPPQSSAPAAPDAPDLAATAAPPPDVARPGAPAEPASGTVPATGSAPEAAPALAPAPGAQPALAPSAASTAPAPAEPDQATPPDVAQLTDPAPVPDAPPQPATPPGARPAVADATPQVTPGQTTAVAQAPQPDAPQPPVVTASALAEPMGEPAAPAAPPSVSITVQPGYTLWGIARQQLGEGVLYVQVFEVNKDRIRNPDLIYPGQVFVLPTR